MDNMNVQRCGFCGGVIPQRARPRFFRWDDGRKPVHAKCLTFLLTGDSTLEKVPLGR